MFSCSFPSLVVRSEKAKLLPLEFTHFIRHRRRGKVKLILRTVVSNRSRYPHYAFSCAHGETATRIHPLHPPPAVVKVQLIFRTIATKAFSFPHWSFGRKKPSCCHSNSPTSSATGGVGEFSLSRSALAFKSLPANEKRTPFGVLFVGGEGEI